MKKTRASIQRYMGKPLAVSPPPAHHSTIKGTNYRRHVAEPRKRHAGARATCRALRFCEIPLVQNVQKGLTHSTQVVGCLGPGGAHEGSSEDCGDARPPLPTYCKSQNCTLKTDDFYWVQTIRQHSSQRRTHEGYVGNRWEENMSKRELLLSLGSRIMGGFYLLLYSFLHFLNVCNRPEVVGGGGRGGGVHAHAHAHCKMWGKPAAVCLRSCVVWPPYPPPAGRAVPPIVLAEAPDSAHRGVTGGRTLF